jgi:iron complex outermembrane receptor protein
VLDLDSIDSFGIANGAEDPGTGFWIDGNTNKLSHDLAEGTDNKSTVAILNVTHELNDTMTLKWISGLIDAELDRFFDNDLVGGLDGIGRENSYEGTSWSTEFRLEVNDERFDFVGGVMYAKDEQDQENNVFVSSNSTATINGTGILPPFPEGLGLALNSKEWELESWAVFADLTFHLTDRLDIVVGARYTDDEVTQSRTDYGIGPTCCFPGSPGYPGGPGFDFFQSFDNFERPSSSGKEDFDQITPRVVLRYSFTDDLSMYASYSEGYKAGGLSLGNNTNEEGQPAFAIPFEEESLTNYEVGMKSEFYDNRVRLNASLYYMEWEDFQMESFRFLTPGDLSSNFEQTINIDEAEAWGGEIELLALLGEGWTFTAGLGYTDSEIKKSPIAEITGGFQVELEGLDLPKAPEFMANAAIEYRFPVGDSSEGWVQVEFVHRDGQYADIEALTYQQTDGPSPNQGLARNSIAQYGDYPFRTPDYDVWNLRAGMEMEHWAFTLYVQNLDGEDYYTGTQENFGVSGMRLRPTPRTIGGSVAYRF